MKRNKDAFKVKASRLYEWIKKISLKCMQKISLPELLKYI